MWDTAWAELRDFCHKLLRMSFIQYYASHISRPPTPSITGLTKHSPCWMWQINEAPLPCSLLSIIRLSWWRVHSWVPGGCTRNTHEELCTEGFRWHSSHQEPLRSACEPRQQAWIESGEQSQHALGGTGLLCVLETHRETELGSFCLLSRAIGYRFPCVDFTYLLKVLLHASRHPQLVFWGL